MSTVQECAWCPNDCDGSMTDEECDAVCLRCYIAPRPSDKHPRGVAWHLGLNRAGKKRIIEVLDRNRWAITKTSSELGVPKSAFYHWLSRSAASEMQRARSAGLLYRGGEQVSALPRQNRNKATFDRETVLRIVAEAGGLFTEAAKIAGLSQGNKIAAAMKRLAPAEYEALRATKAARNAR